LSYRNRTASGLGYTITGNASHWNDVVSSLPENVRPAYPGDATHSIVGRSRFSIFGYKTDGLFQSQSEVDKHATQPGAGPGRIRYVDVNGDGKIDANDQTWLGTTLPKYEYGIRVDLTYKSFDLSFFGSGVAGKTGFDPTKFFNSFVNVRNNFGPGALDAWTPQHTGSKIPAGTVLNANGEDKISDFYYVNASYFKVRNAMLGYNLAGNIARKLRMEGLRIYVSGQNLFAIKSKEFNSKDPERSTAFGRWPVPTTVTFGLNATF